MEYVNKSKLVQKLMINQFVLKQKSMKNSVLGKFMKSIKPHIIVLIINVIYMLIHLHCVMVMKLISIHVI